MPRRKSGTMVVKDARTLRALRTPIRQDILGALERLGRASVGEIADVLGRKRASLYYHVHELQRAGLVTDAGARPAGRKQERLYEAAAAKIIIDRTAGSRAFGEALKGLHRTALRTAEREIAASLERSRSSGDRTADETSLIRLTSRLSVSDARRARKMLMDVARFIEERNSPEARDTYSFTASLIRLAE